MAQKRTVNLSTFKIRQGWRVTWYSVLIWLLAFIIGGFVILPWYYLALPILILWITIVYFRQTRLISLSCVKRRKNDANEILSLGLWLSLTWFFVIFVLTLFEIAGFYYFNFAFFLSDFRNWLLFPLVLLVPFVYSLILENKQSFSANRRSLRSSPAMRDAGLKQSFSAKNKYKPSKRTKEGLTLEGLLNFKSSKPSNIAG